MNPEELRRLSLETANNLDNHGDVGNLIKNAELIYDYLISRATVQAKPIEAPIENDALAFISKLKLPGPDGVIPFTLHDHQKRIVQWLDASHLIINSARQMGVTSTLAAYCLFEAVTTPNQTIMWLSDSYTSARHSLMMMYDIIHESGIELPSKGTTGRIEFANGSTIFARSFSEHAVCGVSLNRVVIDNAAFISHKKFNEGWAALMPCLLKSGKIVLASSPNVAEGLFYQIWVFGGPQWRKLLLPWYENAALTDSIMRIKDNYSEAEFAKSFCCSFVVPSN